MISIKSIIVLLIPTSVLGFSLYWWRKKLRFNGKEISADPVSQTPLVLETKESETNDTVPKQLNEDVTPCEKIHSNFTEDSSPILCKNDSAADLLMDDSIIDWCLESDSNLNKRHLEENEEIILEVQEDSLQSDSIGYLKKIDTLTDLPYHDAIVKRIRQQSSCDGDSAFVEDYSSDSTSMNGSDSLLRSPKNSISFDRRSTLSEEINDDMEKLVNLFELSVENEAEQEEVNNWGSTPMSDEEDVLYDSLITIGNVPVDRLSISFDDVKETVKSPKSPSKSNQKKKMSKREKSKFRKGKKLILDLDDTKSKKGRSSPKKESKKTNLDSPRKGIDGPWRGPESPIAADNFEEVIEYEFPEELCGRLIGKSGKHVAEMKQRSGASICIEPEMRNEQIRVVSIAGLSNEIKKAEKILNARFDNRLVKISDISTSEAISKCQTMSLPAENDVDVIVTAFVDAGNFFVQLFSTQNDADLIAIQSKLAGCYLSPRPKFLYSEEDQPCVGDYCAAYIDYAWCRMRVVEALEDGLVSVSYLDYGGVVTLPTNVLLKSRPDFFETPFQAVECYLANVVPHEHEIEYSYDASTIFSQLVEGKVLKLNVVSQRNGIPCVNLTYENEETQQTTSVNEELEKWGLVRWSEV